MWKPIEGFEGYYVSDRGEIRRNKILKKRYRNGYIVCCLRKNGKSHYKSVHKLVAEYFVPNINNEKCVNHINGNKTDNRSTNLEWCSQKENIQHDISIGLIERPILQYTKNNEFIREWNGSNEASKFYKCSRSTIERVCTGENKSGKGFVWKYKYPTEYYNDDDITTINDFENYRITRSGKVLNPYNRLLDPILNQSGQLYITLCKNGTKKNMYIHRLVAQAYIPNPQSYIYIRHKDGNKQNNSVENLEWWG